MAVESDKIYYVNFIVFRPAAQGIIRVDVLPLFRFS